MTAPLGLPDTSDAELVGLVLQADRDAFALVYDRYGPRLYDFAYSMLRQREDAADAVADSFVTFAEKLAQLRDPSRLRPWLYAIVRSECLRRLKQRTRISYGEDEQLAEIADAGMAPDEAAEKAALQKLVWDAAAGLADRDRALLDLHLRQGLEGAELGEAMGVGAANAYVMLNRLRTQVDRSLGALLIARRGREDCAELDALLGDWDGSFSPLVRKRVARHVESCATCGERRARMLSPWMLLAGVPMFAAPAALRRRVLDDTELVAYVGSHRGDLPAGVVSHRRAASAGLLASAHRRRPRLVAAAVAAALLIGGAVLFWPDHSPAAPDDLVAGQSLGGGAPSTSTPTVAPTPTVTTPTLAATPTLVPPTLLPPTSAVPTVTAAPGALTLSTTAINLGATRSTGAFRVTNSGGTALSFLASPATGSVRVSPASKILAPGGSATVQVVVDRSQLVEGPINQTINVTSGSTGAAVRLTGSHEVPPRVRAAQVGASTCSPSGRTYRVSVVASDGSGVKAVRLSWSGAASGSAPLTSSPTRWSGLMGPFATGGPVTITAVATDARGNTARAVRTFDVTPCPQ